ncbi:MAG TPA: hypothetical protein VNB90_15075 [Cytophagaceae bacterium]|jgi:hypothetical protein|nr:hypothetical protein [Cytophagaceae bacterium]
MPVIGKYKYNAEMIENIYQQLKTCEEAGEAREYEIRVDQQRVVPRTFKSALFYSFDTFVNPSTRSVEIIFYFGESRFNERYIFWFEGSGISSESAEGLSGFDSEIKIRERVRKEYELNNLLKENKELLEEIEELEEDLDEVEEENEKLKAALEEERAKGNDLMNSLIRELGTGVIGTALKGKLGIQGSGLSGTEESNEDTKVNISKEDSFDEETQKAVAFAGYLKERFQGIQYQKLMHIIDKLAEDNSLIEEVWEVVTEEGGKDE